MEAPTSDNASQFSSDADIAENVQRTLNRLSKSSSIEILSRLQNGSSGLDHTEMLTAAALAYADVNTTFLRLLKGFQTGNQFPIPRSSHIGKALERVISAGLDSRSAIGSLVRLADPTEYTYYDPGIHPGLVPFGPAVNSIYPGPVPKDPVTQPQYPSPAPQEPAAHAYQPAQGIHNVVPLPNNRGRFTYESPYANPPGQPLYGSVACPTQLGPPPWYSNHASPQPYYPSHPNMNYPTPNFSIMNPPPVFIPTKNGPVPCYPLLPGWPATKPAYIDLTEEVDARLAARRGVKSSEHGRKRRRDSFQTLLDRVKQAEAGNLSEDSSLARPYNKRPKHTHERIRETESWTQDSHINTQTGDSSFSSMHEELVLREKRRLEEEEQEPRVGKKRRIEAWVSAVPSHGD